jgi:hypothetical protein
MFDLMALPVFQRARQLFCTLLLISAENHRNKPIFGWQQPSKFVLPIEKFGFTHFLVQTIIPDGQTGLQIIIINGPEFFLIQHFVCFFD